MPVFALPTRWTGVASATLLLLFGAMPGGVFEAGAREVARAAIAAHCERCHSPLPGGGWEVMTASEHDRGELLSLLRRMEEEFSAFPSDEEREAIIDYLGQAE